MAEHERLEQAIAHLESQRATLGDAVVDAAVAALRQQLAVQEKVQREAPHAEQRKQVTVLFADLAGFTTMAEHMDPEDLHEIMQAYFEHWREAIVDHGGTIEKFIGDAVMAVFGLPTAREDDPERAIRAGLMMLGTMEVLNRVLERERGLRLKMRIGINTGPVLVSYLGHVGEEGIAVIGDTVNLAARLEQAAPVDCILISHDTYRHVRGLFEVIPQKPFMVKGKAEPIQTYVAKRTRARTFHTRTRGIEGIETSMIGRDAELLTLKDGFHSTMAGDGPRLITVVGEAGVGKSRLLFEFENWLDLLPGRILHFRGRAGREMQSVPYALIRDVLSLHFQIQDSDPPDVVRTGVEQGIGKFLGKGERGQLKSHFIGQLLGFDFSDSPHLRGVLDDARQLHDRALIYINDYFKAAAAQMPTVMLLEDLHWADDSSLDVLNHLARATPDCPLFIVCLARPGLFERRPHWGDLSTSPRVKGQHFHTRVELYPLSKQDSCRLVGEILQKVDQVPEALRDLIVERAEGNPFYVEELVKMLIEDGVIVKREECWLVESARLTTVRIPPTLTGVLQARLDSLSAEERTVLQQASVVGRTFWDSALARISASASAQTPNSVTHTLSALQVKEMVFRRKVSTFWGTMEYIFKHAILCEVTYESVLKRLRRIYHALVAEWLIEQSGERAGEYTGLIADHLELAGETERAVDCLRRAGERAAARFANAEATRLFSRALELIPEDGPAEQIVERYNLLLDRERVLDLQGMRESQHEDLAALQALAEALDDDRRCAEVALRRAHYAEVTGDFAASIAAAQAATRLARAGQHDVGTEAAGYLQWGRVLWRQGDYDAGRVQLNRALALAQTANLRRVEADVLRNLGVVSWYLGDLAGANTHFEQAMPIYQEIGCPQGEMSTLNNLGLVAAGQRDYVAAKGYFEQALRADREAGDRYHESLTLGNLGAVVHEWGDYALSWTYREQALELCRTIGNRQTEAVVLGGLSITSLRMGDSESAWEYAQQVLRIGQELGDRLAQAYGWTYLGHAMAELERLEEAIDAYQEALEIRRELGQHGLAMDALAGLARVFMAQGDLPQAQAYVEEILSFAQSSGLASAEEILHLYLTCYRVLSANQDPRADEILHTAHTLLQEQAARFEDDRLKRSFLENVAAHREIVEEWESR